VEQEIESKVLPVRETESTPSSALFKRQWLHQHLDTRTRASPSSSWSIQ